MQLTTTEKLNFRQIPAWVGEIAQQLITHGFQAYLVGGAVRDLLWGKEPNDWDLASDALPEQVIRIFGKTITTGEKFGTIAVIWKDYTAEITTLREDLAYDDGRHPREVHFTKEIVVDLARRDFTINAVAYDFSSGELVDPFGGKRDIRQRLLKAVGDPGRRFREDGLRMFRFYRFLAALELRPHRPTEKAVNPGYAAGVSFERIRDEFSKLLVSQDVGLGLQGLYSSGLLNVFIPELINPAVEEKDRMFGKEQLSLWNHSKATVIAIRPSLHLRLAALLHDIAKPLTKMADESGAHFYGHEKLGAELGKTILERLRYPQKIINPVIQLIQNHMFYIDDRTSDGAIRRLVSKVGPELIFDLLELRRADIVATDSRIRSIDYQTWELWRELCERVTQVLAAPDGLDPFKLAINGKDLMEEFQLTPGPEIGDILYYLKEQILDEPAQNQKPVLLELARKFVLSKGNRT
jgi:poly(A) polymerase/tRNA nucleotidyltransferase (CCA-adding enzyme)